MEPTSTLPVPTSLNELVLQYLALARQQFDRHFRRAVVAAIQPYRPHTSEHELDGLVGEFTVTQTGASPDKTLHYQGHPLFTYRDTFRLDGTDGKLTIVFG